MVHKYILLGKQLERERNSGWVFGCIERGSRKLRMIEVALRDANTLLPLIADWIEAGIRY